MSKAAPPRTSPAVRALVSGLVDYAGLFPPARLDMADAMKNYAEYLRGPHAWMLGRLVVPMARLAEFDATSTGLLPSGEGSAPWRIAALAGNDLEADVQQALKFNCRHWQSSGIGHAIIDTIEVRAAEELDVADIRAAVPDFFALYVELASERDQGPMLESIKRAGARAKIRLGGVTPEVFPAPDDVIGFMTGCAENSLAFKATAGLHHVIRSDYPLTYEAGSRRATMYGFLNVFVAGVALFSGVSSGDARDILLESDLKAFQFHDAGVAWRELEFSADGITRARAFATSFGSCSFREPVDELSAAGLV